MRTGIVVTLAVLLAGAPAASAAACDCGPTALDEAFAAAHAVFVGAIRQRPAANAPYPRGYVFEVERAWKGVRAGERVTLWEFGSTCDSLAAHRESPRANRYVVFAQMGREGAEAGRLHGDYCLNPSFHWRTSWDHVLAAVDVVATGSPGTGAVFRVGCEIVTSTEVA